MHVFIRHKPIDQPIQLVEAQHQRLQRHAHQIGLVPPGMRLAARDVLPRHAHHYPVSRHGFHHDSIRADAAVVADRDRAEDLRASAHRHTIAQAVPGVCRGAAVLATRRWSAHRRSRAAHPLAKRALG